MHPRLKTVLVQVGSFVLGGGLLWLALRNVDFGEVWTALAQANYLWLLPLVVLAMGSHVLRAWRWQMLLEALPEARAAAPVRFRPVFFSLMIGYMVNYAAPRLGEVARTANLAARTPLPFSGVLGTVVVERVLDVLTLAVGLLLALGLLAGETARLAPLFAPAAALVEDAPVAWWVVVLVGLGVTVGLVVLFRRLLQWSARREGVGQRVVASLRSFRSGLLSVLNAKRRLGILGTTVGIWVCYWFMAYFPLRLLGIAGLDLGDAWVLLVVGSVGMSVPSPGGVGSYHYVTIQTMTVLFAVGTAAATAYAVLSHAAQLVLYTLVGFTCVLLQGSGLRSIQTARPPAENPPADPLVQGSGSSLR